MSGIFNTAIFNDAIFNTETAAQIEIPVALPQPAGRAARQRRKYVMPDGTMLQATAQEAFEWQQHHAPPPFTARPARTRSKPKPPEIQVPAIVLEKRDVRFIPAAEPNTWQAVINERFIYAPPPEVALQMQALERNMRDDENAIVALLMM